MSNYNSSIIVGAHRGCDIFTPENTLVAIDYVVLRGARAIEIDCRLTSDGVVVLMHDLTVDRTTNGHGNIEEMTYDEVKMLDAGGRIPKFHNTKVPTLDSVLAYCKEKKVIVCIEIKSSNLEIVEKIATLIEKHRMEELVNIYCFQKSIIEECLRKNLPYPIHLSFQELTREDILLAKEMGYSLTACYGGVDQKLIAFAKKNEVILHLWTINHLLDWEVFSREAIAMILTDTLLTLSQK